MNEKILCFALWQLLILSRIKKVNLYFERKSPIVLIKKKYKIVSKYLE